MNKYQLSGVAQLFGKQIQKCCQYNYRQGKDQDIFNAGYPVFNRDFYKVMTPSKTLMPNLVLSLSNRY
ncbi:MAG: hypothetical protein WCP32_18780, partial [Bacteroidota bacterium]